MKCVKSTNLASYNLAFIINAPFILCSLQLLMLFIFILLFLVIYFKVKNFKLKKEFANSYSRKNVSFTKHSINTTSFKLVTDTHEHHYKEVELSRIIQKMKQLYQNLFPGIQT